MDTFEYKVLRVKARGVTGHWFDGDRDLGPELTTEVLAPYGADGWEVVATMQMEMGTTHKIILQRRGTGAA